MIIRDILNNRTQWIPNAKYQTLTPEVSIILPTFARAKSGYFQKAVQSVLNQSFTNWELIIVDDCSVDGSFDIIKKYMAFDSRINCIRHTENIGLPAISEYEGYVHARGTYIAFIFDDNEWYKNALEKTISFMKEKKVEASYGIGRAYDNKDGYIDLGTKDYNNSDMLYWTNYIANGAVVLHRVVVETVGLYDPNIILRRVCDWDLWRRIIKKFQFVGTNIFFTKEYGNILADSLGNTQSLDMWAAEEITEKERNDFLKPTAFLNCDVFGLGQPISSFARDEIKNSLLILKNKTWFDVKSVLEDLENSQQKDVFSVVVLCPLITASEMLTFRALQNSPSFIVKFLPLIALPLVKLFISNADILIVSRIINLDITDIVFAKKIDILRLFFIDDNFMELAKDKDSCIDDAEQYAIKTLSDEITQQNLEKYSGVICSTKQLGQYFIENNLCLGDNCIVVPPSCENKSICDTKVESQFNEKIKIAFLGGKFRTNEFLKYVYPNIISLSKEKTVELIIPADINIASTNEHLHIIKIPRNINLSETLKEYGKYDIDILVHCGKKITNNLYKTKNAAINARDLGALLLVSNIAPYKETGGCEYITVDNTENEWKEKLFKYGMNFSEYIKARKTFLKSINSYYAEETSLKNLNEFLLNNIEPESQRLQSRCELMLELLKKYNVNMDNDFSNGQREFLNNAVNKFYEIFQKKYTNGDRIYTGIYGNIKGIRSYKIKTVATRINQISVFPVFFDQHNKGSIEVSLFKGNRLITKKNFMLKEIISSNPIIIRCEDEDLVKEEVYDLKIQTLNVDKNKKISILENRKGIPFFAKVLRKFDITKFRPVNSIYVEFGTDEDLI